MIYQFMLKIQYKTVYQEGPDLAVCLVHTDYMPQVNLCLLEIIS